MELLVMQGQYVVRYEVNYNEKQMQNFFNKVIEKYSYTKYQEVKVKDKKEISRYGDICVYESFVKNCQDNSKIHQGRKRIDRKPQPKKLLYRIVTVDYPEICYTIFRFLNQKNMDFRIFEKYFKVNVDDKKLDYFKEEGMSDVKKELFVKLDSEYKQSKKNRLNAKYRVENFAEIHGNLEFYKNDVTEKRIEQGECLKEFIELIFSNAIYKGKLSIENYVFRSFDVYCLNYIYNNFSFIKASALINEIEQARINSEMLKKIENIQYDNVKKL